MLSPIEERTVGRLQILNDINNAKAAGSVHTFMTDQVWLFTLGSASRGMLYKEWAIPLLVTALESCGFYPGADIIAFIKMLRWMWMCVYLSSESSLSSSDFIVMWRLMFI